MKISQGKYKFSPMKASKIYIFTVFYHVQVRRFSFLPRHLSTMSGMLVSVLVLSGLIIKAVLL